MTDQELIQALLEHAEWARANEWECPITLGDDIYTAIQRLEQMPQWIPVTERLPEVWRNDETAELVNYVNYMIYSPDFGVDIGSYRAKAKKWLCVGLPCVVTHWMPLPAAPGEEPGRRQLQEVKQNGN